MASFAGKHRKQSRAVRGIAKVVVAGAIVAVPMSIAAIPASADTSTVNWDSIAQCESGGNWSTNTGNGFYGGLQFTESTWKANGGTGMPQNASRDEQIAVAQRVAQTQGMHAWPVCSVKAGQAGAHVSSQHSSSHHSTAAPTTKKSTHKATTPAAVTTTAAPQSAPNGDYTVAAGDTLSSIAQKLNVAGGWESLWNNNKSIVANPNLIFPGQSLVTK